MRGGRNRAGAALNRHTAHPEDPTPIRVGVSACLLGQQVRYDAGHKLDRFIAEVLPHYFELVPVCPEVAIGLGVPRPPIHLVGDPERPRAVGVKDAAKDYTEPLMAYGVQVAGELADISGYIFKSKSPSCGMERVLVRPEGGGVPAKRGRGIFAAEIMRRLPLLPVEEEGRLTDAGLRENFIGRVYAYRRWQRLVATGVTAERVVAFHTRHKLILMAHGKERMRELGQLVAQAGRLAADELAQRYIGSFMQALSFRATRRRHTDVLFHIMGYLKRELDAGDKAELVQVITDYRLGRVPLIVPITLLRHHFRRHPHPYIEDQLYLNWPPADLGLRNAI
jgi:uncharacterized protein YbgA (DUF1722 family)/uncharacterized protein YbbK (DUF523 family)